ncbi:MAG: 50S ribosomal protein L22 [Candidatus Micrarchaeia archaeon]
MHKYTFKTSDKLAYAQAYDVNASYKDLCAVCDAIRYAKVTDAENALDAIAAKAMPIRFKRFNKRMGARHELGGSKGAYPVNAAKEVKKVLVNAIANAQAKGIDQDNAIVAYATANKTHIERRYPSKGSLSWGRGMYGFSARVHSDIEYAKIEIALASPEDVGKKPRKIHVAKAKYAEAAKQKGAAKKQKQEQKQEAKPAKPAERAENKMAAEAAMAKSTQQKQAHDVASAGSKITG